MREKPGYQKFILVGAVILLAAYGLVKFGNHVDRDATQEPAADIGANTPTEVQEVTDEAQVAQTDMGASKFQAETPPHTPQSQFGKIASLPGQGSSVPPTPYSGRETLEPAKPQRQPGGCVTEVYVHKKLDAHANGEACSNHNNLLSINHWNINPKSVCVRVNGKPVRFKTKAMPATKNHYVLLGSVAGPRSQVTVSYCSDGFQCTEDCKVQTDAFMSAIGGQVDSFADQSQLAGWDPNGGAPNAVEVRLNKELASLESEFGGSPDGKNRKKAIFKEWIQQNSAPSCLNAMSTVEKTVRMATRSKR